LQWLIEFPDRFLFVDAFVALQALDTRVCSFGNRIRELRLAAAGGPSSSSGFWSLAARYTVVVAIVSAM